VTAHVHEASDRLGGRCWTIRDSFDEGQIAEHGGELIDQGHTAIRHLAQELGLRLDNLLQAERNGTEPLYWFDGAALHQRAGHRRPQAGLAEDPQDVSAASYPRRSRAPRSGATSWTTCRSSTG